MLFLDEERAEIDRQSDENFGSGAGIDHLAYLSYTSGSTGVPKGVAIPHRGVVRLVKSGGFAEMGEDEVFLQMAPVGFDASTFEIWGALLNGGRLVVMPPGTPSLEELGLALRQNSVTTLWLTAGLFHLMVDERLDDLRGLRQLLAGGDVLSPAHVRRAVEALPDCKIINGYGPTENTTFSCCHTIDLADARAGRNTARAADREHHGLHFGRSDGARSSGRDRRDVSRRRWSGAGVLAATGTDGGVVFCLIPSARSAGARLYKSGDLGRWRADGVIEFAGRRDDQVKVSGYRIELGEIETALRQHEKVRDAAVAVRERRPGSREFVAYVIPAARPEPSADELREFLRRTLPDAAIPVDYVFVEVFPLTSNGKVDRRALSGLGKPSARTSAPPQTNLERTISALWREVIGHPDEIGVNENFFDLGGSSLRVIEVHARLERARAPLFSADGALPISHHPNLIGLSRLRGAHWHRLCGNKRTRTPPARRSRTAAGVAHPEMNHSEPSLDGIAIIGLEGRFPEARNAAEFWKNLVEGKDCITRFTDDQLAASGYDPKALRALPGYVAARGLVDKPEWFDRAFFGIPTKEAEVMDPQHRVFLEIAWAALEDAGCDPSTYPGLIGLFAGTSNSTYYPYFVRQRRDLMETVGVVSAVIANEKDFLTNRAAYKLGLRGPALNIQTACSTSLVTVCVACQSLLDHGCDIALGRRRFADVPAGSRILLPGRQHDLAGWLVPSLRCGGERHCFFQRRRRRCPQAARRCNRRWRSNLRRHQRPGAQQRWLLQSQLCRAERERAYRSHRARASQRRHYSRHDFLHRGAWNSDTTRRSDRDRRPDPGIPRHDGRPAVLRPRLGQRKHRTSRRRFRCGQSDQNRARPAPRPDPAQPPLPDAESRAPP